MTAFAIDFHPDRLTIASDTLGYIPSGAGAKPAGFYDKVHQIPHLNAVIFARGQLWIAAWAAVHLAMGGANSLENAALSLPAALREITQKYAEIYGISDIANRGVAEVVFAGWSKADRRMKIWGFNNYEDYVQQEDGGRFYGFLTMPQLPEQMRRSSSTRPVDDQLVDAMKAERVYFATNSELMGGATIGGEVKAVEIRPEGISTRTLHRFEDFESTSHAVSTVGQRILAGCEKLDLSDGLTPVDKLRNSAEVEPARLSRQQRRVAARGRAKRAA